MNFNKQDREGRVTLSEAKGLSRWAQRCFASLSMTTPVVVVNIHQRILFGLALREISLNVKLEKN
jgi:hypothetical protein